MAQQTRIGIVSGSNRSNSESSRIAGVCAEAIGRIAPDVQLARLDLSVSDIPAWKEDRWTPGSPVNEMWAPYSQALSGCSGFVFVVPEWAGMVPPQVKNLLLMCDKGELAHKPGLIVSISSGMGGAYPVSELRSSGYKNNQICWLPDHVIIRDVKNIFTSTPRTELDRQILDRLEYSLRFTIDFAACFGPIREKNQDLGRYKYGM